MSGHLFVTRGSLTSLRCDAILVPSGTRDGRFGDIKHHWRGLPLPMNDEGFVEPSPDREQRAVEAVEHGHLAPAIWVGHSVFGRAGRTHRRSVSPAFATPPPPSFTTRCSPTSTGSSSCCARNPFASSISLTERTFARRSAAATPPRPSS